jgi:ABC-type Fe3+-siderophore transport system permease subunit
MTFPRLPRLVCALLVIGVLVPSSASALTLGNLPSTDPGSCGISSSLWLMQVASTTATYVVPAGGGIITGGARASDRLVRRSSSS